MLGVSVLLGVELLGGGSSPVISGTWESLAEFASTLFAAVSSSAILASFSITSTGNHRRGQLLLEGVVASLTSSARAGSSITAVGRSGSALDDAVDLIISSLDIAPMEEEANM